MPKTTTNVASLWRREILTQENRRVWPSTDGRWRIERPDRWLLASFILIRLDGEDAVPLPFITLQAAQEAITFPRERLLERMRGETEIEVAMRRGAFLKGTAALIEALHAEALQDEKKRKATALPRAA